MSLKNLLFFAFLAFPGLLLAQSFNAELSFGMTGSQIDGDDIAGYNKIGLFAGGGVGIPLQKDKLFLRSVIFYAQKGSHSTAKDPFYLRWRVSYLEIPLTLQYMFTKKIYGLGGLGADILLSSKIDTYGFSFSDNSETMKKAVPLIIGGVGYFLSPKLAFNIRFMYSLLSAGKLEASYTNTIAVYLSYKLK